MIVIKSARVRRALRLLIPFALMPALIALGIVAFRQKRYALVSLMASLLAFVLFAAGFEKKRTGSRRLIIVSIMVALSVAGRFLPVLKPVSALTTLCGMYLGGEAGYLCGALSAVISNFYFGQGPWTPFQMQALGLIGFFAGALHAPLQRSKLLLLLYGILSGIAYSFMMDVWTVLWYNGHFAFSLYLAALASALPYTISYCSANVIFLMLFARPFGEKLARVRLKYGV